jgi:hypothetical protein
MASKARLKIVNAFDKYTASQSTIDDLNVLLLCQLSDVNRVTFYRQFKDITDFLKWFILKDFIFHHKDAQPFTFKEAFLKVFTMIETKRSLFRKIFLSKFSFDLIKFVETEIFAYQVMKFNRIDTDNVLVKEEMITHASFYAAGINKAIMNFILDDRFMNISALDYTSFNLRIVKEYIERGIARKKAKAYDVKEEHVR